MRTRLCRLLLPVLLLALIGISAPPAWGQAAASCPLDCNGDGRVTILDIMLFINGILVDNGSSSTCPGVNVFCGPPGFCDPFFLLINEALNGCPPAPPPANPHASNARS